jgi:hypothetical protein
MFSSTTIASSTIIPLTSTNEKTLTALSDTPITCMKMTAHKNANGIPTIASSALRIPMATHSTTKTITMPTPRLFCSTPNRLAMIAVASF